jgi:hypothetical protein
MLHLRNVRLSDVILRNVTGLSSRNIRANYSTDDSEVSKDVEEKSGKSFGFQPVKEEGRLTFRLPDLSEREETYLKQQIRIILKPNCLQQEPAPGNARNLKNAKLKYSMLLNPL